MDGLEAWGGPKISVLCQVRSGWVGTFWWELQDVQGEVSISFASTKRLLSDFFQGDHILEQYQKYKSYTSQDEAGVKKFQQAVQALGTIDSADCLKVLQKYGPVHAQFTDVQRNVYFGKKEITDKIYNSDSVSFSTFYMCNVVSWQVLCL